MSSRFTLLVASEDPVLDGLVKNAPVGLPHEKYLLGNPIALGPLLANSDSGIWALIEPVHFHATRDHLVLINPDQLTLSEPESSALLNAIADLFENDGFSDLKMIHPKQWVAKATTFRSLTTYSSAQAQGRNIDWWLPKDSSEMGLARRWRKLQNEIQMLWHIHPVNQRREAENLPMINSVWISGIGQKEDLQFPKTLTESDLLMGDSPFMKNYAEYHKTPYQNTFAIHQEKNTFAFFNQPKHIWSDLYQAVMDQKIELEIIDFPAHLKSQARQRYFSKNDFSQSKWIFWKKNRMPTWQDMLK
jgi:hypothetical protein